MKQKTANFAVCQLAEPLGAEIAGVDLGQPMSDATFRHIEDAFHEHCVLAFRNQRLTPQAHIAFSRRFGDLLVHVLKQHNDPDFPQVLVLSNIVENGKPIGIQDGGQYWHTDLSYTAEPSRCSLLYAVEIPFENGVALGDTLFVNTCAAYEALPDEMKARLAGLRATHNYNARYSQMRQKGSTRTELDEGQKKAVPEVVHPVVRTHPFTGRKSLYVNEGFVTGIVGTAKAESERLLAELYDHVTQPRFMYRHRWQVGDLLMWDNCSTQHNAVANYGPHQRRHMRRTTVRGSTPF
ncbi:MAG: TauD/TfdA family dioxygenase [Betaproteobacteria bacterium]|nr:TauD/TfdA family dioxygenase [Betaproteobacteria bacterium]